MTIIRVTDDMGRKPNWDTVASYLPENYKVNDRYENGDLEIMGEDHLGWTAAGYIIPRLASGLIVAHIVQ